VVVAGWPELGPGDARARLRAFAERSDLLRTAVICEPRGFDAVVGALLLPPVAEDAVAQVIFFNNVGTLTMCGHGTIGVAATLAHLGRIGPGRHRLETPGGDVHVTLHDDGSVSVANVFSYRAAHRVAVGTEGHGEVVGDIAWGGNWFFLLEDQGPPLTLAHLPELLAFTGDVRWSLARAGIRGDDGGEIDHVELSGPPRRPDADGKNFVLCPGGEYDRSPCGTGTSAKMACLAADGRLADGAVWCQESILGTLFTGTVRNAERDGRRGVLPEIRGRAWITAEATLLLDPTDPFRHGIRRPSPPSPGEAS
jgi:proline racemase